MENHNQITHYLRAIRTAALKLGASLEREHFLQTVVSTMVADFDSAVAQLWLPDEAGDALLLRASAGSSSETANHSGATTNSAGTSRQVAEVARTRATFISRNLAADMPLDRDWIQREKLAAMAAFPLLIGSELRGVLVHFARQVLAEDVVEALAVLATVVTASLDDVQHFTREKQLRAQAEEARQRAAFLAEASTALASSLDYSTTLTSVARLAVPQLADWCAVYMLEADGSIRLLAVTHVDPAKIEWAREVGRRYPPDPSAAHGVPQVLRTGQSEIYSAVPDTVLLAYARDAEHLRLLRSIGLESYMIVPLTARERRLGAIGFASADPRRRYASEDLALAEDLARRAATAIENALLYREAQQAISARDRFLAAASHELRTPLSPIQLQVQFLLRAVRAGTLDKLPYPRLLEMLEMSDRQIKHLVGLINNLLAGFREA